MRKIMYDRQKHWLDIDVSVSGARRLLRQGSISACPCSLLIARHYQNELTSSQQSNHCSTTSLQHRIWSPQQRPRVSADGQPAGPFCCLLSDHTVNTTDTFVNHSTGRYAAVTSDILWTSLYTV